MILSGLPKNLFHRNLPLPSLLKDRLSSGNIRLCRADDGDQAHCIAWRCRIRVRPHTAMGVSKAAGDALALSYAHAQADDLATALAAYDATRRAAGNEIAAYGRRHRGVIRLSFSHWSPGPRNDTAIGASGHSSANSLS